MRVLGDIQQNTGRTLGDITPVATVTPKSSALDGFANVVQSIFPGKNLGNAIGSSLYDFASAGKQAIKGDFKGALKTISTPDPNVDPKKVIGDVVQAVALPTSLALPGAKTVLGAATQFGGLSALQGAGSKLSEGGTVAESGKEGLKSGAVGAVTGGVFHLLGNLVTKVAEKVAPTVASVTSGVPAEAIKQASVNPSVTKEGIKMTVNEVRNKAVSSLQTLHNDLNTEFQAGTKLLGDAPLPTADKISSKLIEKTHEIASEFKLSVSTSAQGLTADFAKSSIVKAGEQNAVNKVLETVSTWDDFSEKGLQALNQRVNAFKNFEEGGVTKSSALVGKIHDALGKVIEEASPALDTLNKNYSTNKKVLDEISNVIGGQARTPTQIQGAVTRLDNLFKENRDEYVNIIRELGNRSGVDYLSLLAGGEFQKLLPNYIRSAVAVGSVGGIGAIASNPLSMLLLPLFSPRAVGAVARNAPKIADTTAKVVRAAATQSIPKVVR